MNEVSHYLYTCGFGDCFVEHYRDWYYSGVLDVVPSECAIVLDYPWRLCTLTRIGRFHNFRRTEKVKDSYSI